MWSTLSLANVDVARVLARLRQQLVREGELVAHQRGCIAALPRRVVDQVEADLFLHQIAFAAAPSSPQSSLPSLYPVYGWTTAAWRLR